MNWLKRYEETWHALGLQGSSINIYYSLRAAYRQPWRKHHSWKHIAESLVILDEVRPLTDRPNEVAFSLMWHDYVWTPHAQGSPGDELRSAVACKLVIREHGGPVSIADNCFRNIQATAHDDSPQTGDAALTADIDMCVVGAPWQRYERYMRDVEGEFRYGGQYTEAEWCMGRQIFLRRLKEHADERLFHLPYFRIAYLKQAKENMEREISMLKTRMDKLKGY